MSFLLASSRFVTLANKDVSQAGRTKLDRERLKACMREMVIINVAQTQKEPSYIRDRKSGEAVINGIDLVAIQQLISAMGCKGRTRKSFIISAF